MKKTLLVSIGLLLAIGAFSQLNAAEPPDSRIALKRDDAKGEMQVLIDGKEAFRKNDWNGPAEGIGFRPWRNRITIADFTLSGELIDPPRPIGPVGQPVRLREEVPIQEANEMPEAIVVAMMGGGGK